jgi:hypothetical protein
MDHIIDVNVPFRNGCSCSHEWVVPYKSNLGHWVRVDTNYTCSIHNPREDSMQLPAVIGQDNRASGVREEEWLRKYVSEFGAVVISTWNERPNMVIDKHYALYVNGTNKADIIGSRISGLVQLRDFLNHVINSETPQEDDK